MDILKCSFCRIQSLLLLTYLVRNGSERVVTSTREHLHDLRILEQYTCYDEYGRDQGLNGMCKGPGPLFTKKILR